MKGSFAPRALWSALTRISQVVSAPLALPFKPDELYRVPTVDGSAVALARYLPRSKRRFAEPVVLCHGLGTNRGHGDLLLGRRAPEELDVRIGDFLERHSSPMAPP